MPTDAETQRLIGELRADVRNQQESNRQLWVSIDALRNEVHSLTNTLSAMSSQIKEAAANASDWAGLKRRGILWLAGIGASGMAAGLGLPKLWAALGKVFFFPA